MQLISITNLTTNSSSLNPKHLRLYYPSAMDSNAPDGSPNGVDLATFPAAAKLVERVGEFMQEVQNL